MARKFPKIKICGQTRLDDIQFSFQSGADYCGVVIEVETSPRALTVARAEHLFQKDRARIFALTANAAQSLYKDIIDRLNPGFLQLTAQESPSEVKQLKMQYGITVFKSLHLPGRETDHSENAGDFLIRIAAYHNAGCDGFVLDTRTPGMYGGSGIQSDWNLATEIIRTSKAKILLAGGITPENAAKAVTLEPYGIDLASGVEISPGIKSREKILALFTSIHDSQR